MAQTRDVHVHLYDEAYDSVGAAVHKLTPHFRSAAQHQGFDSDNDWIHNRIAGLKREREKFQSRLPGSSGHERSRWQEEITKIERELAELNQKLSSSRDRRSQWRDHAYVVARIEGWQLLEGAGNDGGFWFAKDPRGKTQRFRSRRDAEEHIHQESRYYDSRSRDVLKYGQRVPRDVLERLARRGEIELEGDLPDRSGATVQVRQGSKRIMVVVENPTSDSRSRDHAYTVKRYEGGWQLLEGAGTDGGSWFAKDPRGKTQRFNNRRDAEEHIEQESRYYDSRSHDQASWKVSFRNSEGQESFETIEANSREEAERKGRQKATEVNRSSESKWRVTGASPDNAAARGNATAVQRAAATRRDSNSRARDRRVRDGSQYRDLMGNSVQQGDLVEFVQGAYRGQAGEYDNPADSTTGYFDLYPSGRRIRTEYKNTRLDR